MYRQVPPMDCIDADPEVTREYSIRGQRRYLNTLRHIIWREDAVPKRHAAFVFFFLLGRSFAPPDVRLVPENLVRLAPTQTYIGSLEGAACSLRYFRSSVSAARHPLLSLVGW